MPRRLTRGEEDELIRAARRLETAERTRVQRRDELDQLIRRLTEDGARAVDVADVLQITRTRVYEAIRRAQD